MKILQMPDRLTCDQDVLPQVWATDGNLACALQAHADVPERPQEVVREDGAARATPVFRVVLNPQTAFYRSYTEAMLRRYGVLSMESGRVPSMLGREMFRGRVTHYRVHGFDDVVIFVHDVERCIQQLSPEKQRLILRIGVQEYTFGEAAGMLGLSLRSVQRRYFEAVDELTGIFLKRRLLERVASNPCQEGDASMEVVSHTP
jgi:Sigma-70, region 4